MQTVGQLYRLPSGGYIYDNEEAKLTKGQQEQGSQGAFLHENSEDNTMIYKTVDGDFVE
jgi:hypothetical protein